jgi:hypothetical protein
MSIDPLLTPDCPSHAARQIARTAVALCYNVSRFNQK